MDGYTKLFGSIVASSIWGEDNPTRIVWITMLALADENGYVGASVSGLARQAVVSKEECERALAKFMAPDPDSRNAMFDGRRIEVAERGWRLLNHRTFREMRNAEERRKQNAEAQQSARDRRRRFTDKSESDASATVSNRQQPSATVSVCHSESPESAQEEAEADTEEEAEESESETRALPRIGTETLFRQPLGNPPPELPTPTETFFAGASKMFGARHDAKYREAKGCDPWPPWTSGAEAGFVVEFQQLCEAHAKSVAGLDAVEIGAAVIRQFFEATHRNLRNSKWKFLIEDFQDLARSSDQLRDRVAELKRAAGA